MVVNKSIYEIKFKAREMLEGKYKVPVLTNLLQMVLAAVTSFGTSMLITGDGLAIFLIRLGISFILNLFVIAPISMGVSIISLKVSRNEETNVGMIFDGYSYFKKLSFITTIAFIISSIQNVFLFVMEQFTKDPYVLNLSLLGVTLILLVVLTYLAQTDFILYDEKELSGLKVVKKSISIMRGNVLKLICLNLSFILWGMLTVMTFGLILLWLMPYMNVSFAIFYDETIKKEENFEIKIT